MLKLKHALNYLLVSLGCLCLMNNLEASATKAKATNKHPNQATGSAYPQCLRSGKELVRWIPQQMPLRVYVSHGTCLDGAGNDPTMGGPISNADNTSAWPDLVANLISNPDFLSSLKPAELFTEEMRQATIQGISQWKKFEKEGLYSFELTDDPSEADIYFFWTHHFVNKLGLGLFANDIRGYTAKYLLPYAPVMNALNSGQTERIQFKPVVVILRTSDTTGVPMPLWKLQAASAHEMGHVLGIDGHSNNPHDLMSVYYGNGQISANDSATIRYMYKNTPVYLP